MFCAGGRYSTQHSQDRITDNIKGNKYQKIKKRNMLVLINQLSLIRKTITSMIKINFVLDNLYIGLGRWEVQVVEEGVDIVCSIMTIWK